MVSSESFLQCSYHIHVCSLQPHHFQNVALNYRGLFKGIPPVHSLSSSFMVSSLHTTMVSQSQALINATWGDAVHMPKHTFLNDTAINDLLLHNIFND